MINFNSANPSRILKTIEIKKIPTVPAAIHAPVFSPTFSTPVKTHRMNQFLT